MLITNYNYILLQLFIELSHFEPRAQTLQPFRSWVRISIPKCNSTLNILLHLKYQKPFKQ
jgi:hypothetical protein